MIKIGRLNALNTNVSYMDNKLTNNFSRLIKNHGSIQCAHIEEKMEISSPEVRANTIKSGWTARLVSFSVSFVIGCCCCLLGVCYDTMSNKILHLSCILILSILPSFTTSFIRKTELIERQLTNKASTNNE